MSRQRNQRHFASVNFPWRRFRPTRLVQFRHHESCSAAIQAYCTLWKLQCLRGSKSLTFHRQLQRRKRERIWIRRISTRASLDSASRFSCGGLPLSKAGFSMPHSVSIWSSLFQISSAFHFCLQHAHATTTHATRSSTPKRCAVTVEISAREIFARAAPRATTTPLSTLPVTTMIARL